MPDLNGNLTFRKNVTLPRTLQPSLISYELDGQITTSEYLEHQNAVTDLIQE